MDYYASPNIIKNKNFIYHPYGKIPINSDGFYDKEFNFNNNKVKIGYFGDSVTYGVGAGYPYRFTDLLNNYDSNFDHLNLTGGLGISLVNWNHKIEKFLLDKKINRIIYIMNLNDIAPLYDSFEKKENIRNEKTKNIDFLISLANPVDKLLRGRSSLYTFVRFRVKNIFVKIGYDSSGFEAIELFPEKNTYKYLKVAKLIDEWSENLKKKEILTCVIILPYEMQISADASIYYRSIGIKFDKSFENFSTQEILKKNVSNNTNVFILKNGFKEKKIGSYFVFNKGDKIDFNHLNRDGHLVIANQIDENKICQN